MSSRCSIGVIVALCGLAVGCSNSDTASKVTATGGGSETTLESSVPSDNSAPATSVNPQQAQIDLLADVVAALHPGFAYVRFLQSDGNVYYVEARHTLVPGLVVKVWYAANSNDFERSRSADVGGITWRTPTTIDELTEVSSLIVGDLQVQLLQSIVNDTGFVNGNAGRYVVTLGVTSNVEVFARVLETDGSTTDYRYRLDMTASPAVFRYVA